ncbi:hypothetical protein HY025_03100 [Candidatus Daviesbacteria bacterium]|nr:hypothetical protein [Candidatus Daviesbacteria bacterium]
MVKFSAFGQVLTSIFLVSLTLFVLAPAVFASSDSIETQRERRDEQRLTDLRKVNKGIKLTVQESTISGILCNYTAFPCHGNSTTDSSSADGTGWVKINLTQFTDTLPVDPVNNAGANGYHYVYCADKPAGVRQAGWELNTKLESLKYAPLMTSDGGDDNNLYEVGSNLFINGISVGCTY